VIARNEDKHPSLGQTFAINMLCGILQTCSAENRITLMLSSSC